MKTKIGKLLVAVGMVIGLLSFQVVYGQLIVSGGNANGSENITSTAPRVFILKVKAVVGSESGKYDIQVTAAENNFRVEDLQGEQNIAKVGHIHFFLDVKPPVAKGKPAVPAEGSVWAHVSGNNYTFTNVSPGKHKIYVELVNNDHTPLNPAVIAEKTVDIKSS